MAKKKKVDNKKVDAVAEEGVTVVGSVGPPIKTKADVVKLLSAVKTEMGKIVVGQEKIIHGILRAIICNGHVLVEGVPGVAKTLIVRSVASILGCDMKRIQFTVDLLPTDITGIMSYTPDKGFEMIKGPVFTNFVLADEINRSPPKTQSALLEAMQEREVTLSRQTYALPNPFFVMATENPLEVSGVYSLPEAQIDRFLFKLLIGYPDADEEKMVLRKNTTINAFDSYDLKAVLNPSRILELQAKVKEVFTSEAIEEYIIKIVEETRKKDWEYAKYISYGASPRASIALFIASKAEALMHGRDYVTPEDVKTIVYPVLRHRIILNYEAEAEEITTDKVISHILSSISAP
ncbi:MoxR family ATPase [archaeon]|jgi:MoxR-like ATPase|nr:MoxR family ATPase [archaeon]